MWLKRTLISIGIVAVLVAGGFVLYNTAYAFGDADGYNSGYSAGHDVGYNLGHEEGYDLGMEDGYDQGTADGYAAGYDTGYTEGLDFGTAHGLCLRNPSYAEATAFLRDDRTDRNPYVDDSYVCSHFARDVCNNAEAEGLRCAFVELRYRDSGHSIIAFDTTDKGLVYFEPQYDDEVRVEIGRSYSLMNDYVAEGFNDVILDVLVIW
jgi:hypothetical protein